MAFECRIGVQHTPCYVLMTWAYLTPNNDIVQKVFVNLVNLSATESYTQKILHRLMDSFERKHPQFIYGIRAWRKEITEVARA